MEPHYPADMLQLSGKNPNNDRCTFHPKAGMVMAAISGFIAGFDSGRLSSQSLFSAGTIAINNCRCKDKP